MTGPTSAHKDIWILALIYCLPNSFYHSSPFSVLLRVEQKMSSWTPQPPGLEEILRTIHESTDMNVAVQRSITQASLVPALSVKL